MEVEEIIRNAELLAQCGRADYAAYERLKMLLAQKVVSEHQYRTALKRLIDVLGI